MIARWLIVAAIVLGATDGAAGPLALGAPDRIVLARSCPWFSMLALALSVVLGAGACTARQAAYTASGVTLAGGAGIAIGVGSDYDGSDDDPTDEIGSGSASSWWPQARSVC